MAHRIKPITVSGRYFWKGNERFLVNGVVYQLYKAIGAKSGPPRSADPLANEYLDDLERSIPLFKELGLNTLFVFCIDASKNHDAAMNMLAEAGIYVLACISTPHNAIDREAPFESYTADLLHRHFKTVDCMAAYPNTLGLVAANEVINSIPSTAAAPVVRAVVRDVKRYMGLAAAWGQRVLPVGVSSADVRSLLKPQFDYFGAGSDAEGIDFYAFNSYCWCGESSMSMSGYDGLVALFANTRIPVFFSEYGANLRSPRLFQETRAIFSPAMTDVFSGGIVYEFFYGPNEYGLVKKKKKHADDNNNDDNNNGNNDADNNSNSNSNNDNDNDSNSDSDNYNGVYSSNDNNNGNDNDNNSYNNSDNSNDSNDDDDSTCTFEPLPDFENLKASLRSREPEPATSSQSTPTLLSEKPEMPQPGWNWRAEREVPASPVDWDGVRAGIEDREWVLVESALNITIQDIS
ncbi:Glucanosyltransferase-domain-containing protein [Xylariaceae sp. FL0662B]|nr:Glucanosyltransferase-domain-containing protein [Xylariaceae sp. FL0662B]